MNQFIDKIEDGQWQIIFSENVKNIISSSNYNGGGVYPFSKLERSKPFQDKDSQNNLFSSFICSPIVNTSTKDNLYVMCICGHKVKRITYIYHLPTKTVGYIGQTCLKKYGIQTKVSNSIILAVIKENINELSLMDQLVKAYILEKYSIFMTKIEETNKEDKEIDYYDIVAPFRRLLNDVCDLVSEYNFDLVELLKEIERGVESMNIKTKHMMVDELESSVDSLSDIVDVSLSESFYSNNVINSVASENNLEDFFQENHEKNIEKNIEKKNEIYKNGLEETIHYSEVYSEISVESFHKEYLVLCQEEDIDEAYEDDFHEEEPERESEREPKREPERQPDRQPERDIYTNNCCKVSDCYCIYKYRLWKVREELKIYKEVMKDIQNGTKLLMENIEIFQNKFNKTVKNTTAISSL